MTKENWNESNIPDQKGRVVIVTGASSGLGKEASRVLATKNATVILAVRNTTKGEKVTSEIKAEKDDADVQVRELDLSSLKSINTFAETFNKEFSRLDILINNAGVMMCPFDTTEDGFEIQMGTNHMGHFALTGLLLPLLKKTEDSRIVVTSSMTHKFGNIDFTDINWKRRKYKTSRAYGDSKIANLYFMFELVRRLESDGGNPKVSAAHPGWTATELQRHSGSTSFLNRVFAQKIAIGTLPTLRSATDPNVKSGDYFGPKGFMEMNGYPVKVGTNKLAKNAENARKLWEISQDLTGVEY